MKAEKEGKDVESDFSGIQREEEKKERPGVMIKLVTMGWGEESICQAKNERPRESYFFVSNPGL